ncbi:alpha/beta hydrolase [Nocardia thailandica]
MPFFDSDRGRLHYRRWPRNNPIATLALLPGTGQHSGHYHRFAAALGTAGVELYTLDTAGQGLSAGDPAAPGTLPELAADAAGLLAVVSAEATGPVFLIGHSLGAATALALPAEDTEGLAGLVVCGTPPRVAHGTLARPLPVLAVHGVDDRRAAIDPVRRWFAHLPSVTWREYADAGHDLLHEPVSRQVCDDIAAWITDITARAGAPAP